MKLYKDILEPDFRNLCYEIINLDTNESRQLDFHDHYCAISNHKLKSFVPDEIHEQYGIARNLYIYSWYVYEFFNVAHSKLLSILEYALKNGINSFDLKNFIKQYKRKNAGLATLLLYIEKNNIVQSEDFPQWHRVRQREQENTEDFEWNYLGFLVKELPKLRNSYFHGSTVLHDDVLGLFEDFCVIVNKLYE